MIQKLMTVGTSKAVTVSKHALKELGLERVKSVSVTIDPARKRLIIEHPSVKHEEDVLVWGKKFVEEYRPVLEALSKK